MKEYIYPAVCLAAATIFYFLHGRIHARKDKAEHRHPVLDYSIALTPMLCHWGAMTVPQWRFAPHWGWIAAGTITGLIGVYTGFGAMVMNHKFSDEGGLLVKGPYRLFRHPMYVGWMLAVICIALFARSPVSLIYLPIPLLIHIRWGRMEERHLRAKYGQEYIAYCSKVPF